MRDKVEEGEGLRYQGKSNLIKGSESSDIIADKEPKEKIAEIKELRLRWPEFG